MPTLEGRNGESEDEVRLKDSCVPEEGLQRMWDLFVWVCKNQTGNLYFFSNFLKDNSAESLSYRGQNNPPVEMSAFV